MLEIVRNGEKVTYPIGGGNGKTIFKTRDKLASAAYEEWVKNKCEQRNLSKVAF